MIVVAQDTLLRCRKIILLISIAIRARSRRYDHNDQFSTNSICHTFQLENLTQCLRGFAPLRVLQQIHTFNRLKLRYWCRRKALQTARNRPRESLQCLQHSWRYPREQLCIRLKLLLSQRYYFPDIPSRLRVGGLVRRC